MSEHWSIRPHCEDWWKETHRVSFSVDACGCRLSNFGYSVQDQGQGFELGLRVWSVDSTPNPEPFRSFSWPRSLNPKV